ncbi:MAG: NAD(P)H-dependent glycerol-3-phosphate dehydrogenase [Bacteroidales bacterium]|jgi:glycerol-3-phosphate dehydrogenase (NAD(P)+)|nr:NAD(P)H-dependent glycerol-3-phosphate dehydrogenase [Bacteroidales bacterium]
MTLAIIGSGSWATALVKTICNNAERINWYIREPEIRRSVAQYGTNCMYLSSVRLDTEKIALFDDADEAVRQADMLLFAVPAAFLKITTEAISVPLAGKMVFSAIKGIVPGENTTVGEYFNRRFGLPFDRFGVVSGPTHAEEVALERLSYLTVASKQAESAETMAELLGCRYIKTVISTDIYGIEYGGIIKNIIALCAGIAHGLGYGDNFLAALVSNGFAEIKRFIEQSYPAERDVEQSAYLGDLLVTCYSQFSRNRTFGTMIGKGYSVKSAQLEMNMIAEGYYAVACLHEMNRQFRIDLPIVNAVYNILYENISPSVEIRLLSEQFR